MSDSYQTYRVEFTPLYATTFLSTSEEAAIERAMAQCSSPTHPYHGQRPIRVICLEAEAAVAPKGQTGIYGIDAGLCVSRKRCLETGRCCASAACSE